VSDAVTTAAIARAMAAFERRGQPVKCARLGVDGSVLLLTEIPEGALPAVNDDAVDWVSLAGQKEVPRAGRA
jgi:hypothetical protein